MCLAVFEKNKGDVAPPGTNSSAVLGTMPSRLRLPGGPRRGFFLYGTRNAPSKLPSSRERFPRAEAVRTDAAKSMRAGSETVGRAGGKNGGRELWGGPTPPTG